MQRPPVPRAVLVGVVALLALAALPGWVGAGHSWGNYHWARTSNPFTLKHGDNVHDKWDKYLDEALGQRTASPNTDNGYNDWSDSAVVDTTIVAGSTSPKRCRATSGRVEVCADRYGFNGWLGLAQIWASGSHITQGVVKLNDSYFNTRTYDTPGWRRLVMCQEVGHTLGLDHTDEAFDNPNDGTCMDYTNNPEGPPSNERPYAHDYEQLETIYAHTNDGTTTVDSSAGAGGAAAVAGNDPREWGRPIRHDAHGRPILFRKDLGNGQRLFTWVTWTLEQRGSERRGA